MREASAWSSAASTALVVTLLLDLAPYANGSRGPSDGSGSVRSARGRADRAIANGRVESERAGWDGSGSGRLRG